MNIVRLHELIDQWYQEELKNEPISTSEATIEPQAPERKLPEGKRAVRTKSQGDKVFYLDEEKKTRQWVTSPEILLTLGFEIGDVVEVSDEDLMKYQMSATIYRPVDNAAA